MVEVIDYYEVLGVGRDATTEQITRAFKLKMRAVHPDRAGGSADLARTIIEAREVLRDSEQRRHHDEVLRKAAAAEVRRAARSRRNARAAAEHEAARRAAEEEAARQAAREAARRAAEEEAARRAAEEWEATRRAAEEAARRAAEEWEAARRAAEEEAARQAYARRRSHQTNNRSPVWDVVGAIVFAGLVGVGIAVIADAVASDSKRRRAA